MSSSSPPPVGPSPVGLPPVGRVLGTDDATPLSFWVAVEADQYLQLDDVVITDRPLPDGRVVQLAGVVTAMRARHEGLQFDSDVFMVAQGHLPAQVQESAEVSVTRVEPEVFVPPRPGAAAHRATGEARDRALSFDQMERTVTIGMGRDGAPVVLNAEFLDGTRGGHVSISGVSGVATKTTFATWLLHSLFTGEGLAKDRRKNAKALIFNVKGEDLLFLDHANSRLTDAQRSQYALLGVPATPFTEVLVCAPLTPTMQIDVASRTSGVQGFWWTMAEFCQGELLRFVFADPDDERAGYSLVITSVATRLKRKGSATADGAWTIDQKVLRTFGDLCDLLENALQDQDDRTDWVGSATPGGTVNAFLRRLMGQKRAMEPIVRSDVPSDRPHSVSTDAAKVTVIDLHKLPEAAQRFVVGVTLNQEFSGRETGGVRPLTFVMLDELNKYAPREGDSPIKRVLLDIAERGRSLGVILIGAQQTASEVERRIVSNCAIRVVGRLDPAEAGRPEYGFLPASQRQRATLARPGTMFVAQPQIPVPLVVDFPFPAWATRAEEAAERPAGTGATAAERSPLHSLFPTLPPPPEEDIPF